VLCVAFALVVGLIAAIADARTGRIPNWLTLAGVSGGCSLGALSGGWSGLTLALGGAVDGASPWLVGYLLGRGSGVGAGDVKLFAAFGVLLGAGRALELALGALLLALGTWTIRASLQRRTRSEFARAVRSMELRLGPPALAALVVLTLLGPYR